MLFHFAPAIGWMNDPNGLIHWNGRHHLFYQHNPASTTFGTMRWGHASSTDLINWQEHSEALRPGFDGTSYDADGCYSGCAIADDDGGVTLLYTGVAGPMQLPCLARSTQPNLERFEKDAGNPIIEQHPGPETLAFRDHSVRRQADQWHQAIGGKTSDRGGTIFGYTSTNLRDWTFDRLVLDATRCDIPSAIWECPDVFDTDASTVLILSLMADETEPLRDAIPLIWYATGEWVDGQLKPDITGLLDHGDRLYAPQSYWAADGRRIQFGWIRTDLDPAPVGDSIGVMSAPRELVAREDGRLSVTPVRELQRLRDTPTVVASVPGATHTTVELAAPTGAIEIFPRRIAHHCRHDPLGRWSIRPCVPHRPEPTAIRGQRRPGAADPSVRPRHRRGVPRGRGGDLDRPHPGGCHPRRDRPRTLARPDKDHLLAASTGAAGPRLTGQPAVLGVSPRRTAARARSAAARRRRSAAPRRASPAGRGFHGNRPSLDEPPGPRVADEERRDDEMQLVGQVGGEELRVHRPAALDHQPPHAAAVEVLADPVHVHRLRRRRRRSRPRRADRGPRSTVALAQ